MKIRVLTVPAIPNVPVIFRMFLCDLILPVDTSFPCDGFYHVLSRDLVEALDKRGETVAARHWQQQFNCRNWSHLMIPHQACQLWPRETTISLEPLDVLRVDISQAKEVMS